MEILLKMIVHFMLKMEERCSVEQNLTQDCLTQNGIKDGTG